MTTITDIMRDIRANVAADISDEAGGDVDSMRAYIRDGIKADITAIKVHLAYLAGTINLRADVTTLVDLRATIAAIAKVVVEAVDNDPCYLDVDAAFDRRNEAYKRRAMDDYSKPGGRPVSRCDFVEHGGKSYVRLSDAYGPLAFYTVLADGGLRRLKHYPKAFRGPKGWPLGRPMRLAA